MNDKEKHAALAAINVGQPCNPKHFHELVRERLAYTDKGVREIGREKIPYSVPRLNDDGKKLLALLQNKLSPI